jgi:hypothetical protein
VFVIIIIIIIIIIINIIIIIISVLLLRMMHRYIDMQAIHTIVHKLAYSPSVSWISRWPRAHQILPKLPALHRRLSRPAPIDAALQMHAMNFSSVMEETLRSTELYVHFH